jgi:hypothetical protein
MRRITIAMAAAAVALVSVAISSRASSAAVTNGGFESGDLTGWTVAGNVSLAVAGDGAPIAGTGIAGNVVKAHGGGYAAYAVLQAAAPASQVVLSYTVDVEPGTAYEWGFSYGVFPYAPLDCTSDASHTINGVSRGGGSSTTSSGAWHNSKLGTFVPPAGVTSATWDVTLSGSGAGGVPIGVSLDDFFFRPVPEPSSAAAALLMLGTCAALGARRRRLG